MPKKLRRTVIASAGTKWKDFKSRLTTKYIMPYMNDVDLLEFPPDDYRFIAKDVWQEFVAERLSAGFQVCGSMFVFEGIFFCFGTLIFFKVSFQHLCN